MGKVYNLAERLAAANQKPTLEIDAEHIYKINNTTPAAIMMESITTDENLGEFDRIKKVITVGVGVEAMEYIDSLELTTPAMSLIFQAILASVSDTSMEELEERLEENRFQPGKKKSK